MTDFIRSAVDVEVVCESCGSTNHLAVTEIPGDQPVSCSHCGTSLGTVDELLAARAAEAEVKNSKTP